MNLNFWYIKFPFTALIMLFSIGSIILSSAKYISIGVSIPSLKQAFINISVPPKCTYFMGSLALIACISLFIIRLFIIGILAFPLVYLQSFLGLVNQVREYIPNLAENLKPLHKKLKKDVEYYFDKKDQDQIQKIKLLCKKLPKLYFPDENKKSVYIVELIIFSIDKLKIIQEKLDMLYSEDPLKGWEKHQTKKKIELIDENSIITQKPLKYNFEDLKVSSS